MMLKMPTMSKEGNKVHIVFRYCERSSGERLVKAMIRRHRTPLAFHREACLTQVRGGRWLTPPQPSTVMPRHKATRCHECHCWVLVLPLRGPFLTQLPPSPSHESKRPRQFFMQLCHLLALPQVGFTHLCTKAFEGLALPMHLFKILLGDVALKDDQ